MKWTVSTVFMPKQWKTDAKLMKMENHPLKVY